MIVVCQQCKAEFPEYGFPMVCPVCGGLYQPSGLPVYDPKLLENAPGIWRYRHLIGAFSEKSMITLGEGRTPLVEDKAFGHSIFCKLEYLNPTGSCKDRSTAVTVSHLVNRRISSCVIESYQNTGMSWAAYTAKAGIQTKIFIPYMTANLQRKGLDCFDAEWIGVNGGIGSAWQMAIEYSLQRNAAYSGLSLLPHGQDGYATIAYELFEAMGRTIGSLIIPIGNGDLFLGILRGLLALIETGYLEELPVLVGVQATFPEIPYKVLDETKYSRPITGSVIGGQFGEIIESRRREAQARINELGGHLVYVHDNDIRVGLAQLLRRGYIGDRFSAMVWTGFKQISSSIPGPVVLLLTGMRKAIYPTRVERI